MSLQPPRFLFLHVQKAAGTTLLRHVRSEIPQDRLFFVTPGPENIPRSLKELRERSEEDRTRLRGVLGHMPFGVHEVLPGASAYATLLRDPVDRMISHYCFVRRSPDHYLHRAVMEGEMDLAAYVSSGLSPELDNGQTRLLAGDGWNGTRAPHGTVDAAMLERAKRNLVSGRFVVVGTTAHSGTAFARIAECFGWKNLPRERANVTVNRPSLEEISAKTRQEIERLNRHDVDLYHFVLETFPEARGEGGGDRREAS